MDVIFTIMFILAQDDEVKMMYQYLRLKLCNSLLNFTFKVLACIQSGQTGLFSIREQQSLLFLFQHLKEGSAQCECPISLFRSGRSLLLLSVSDISVVYVYSKLHKSNALTDAVNTYVSQGGMTQIL
jgi:hypothetical protein